VPLTERDRHAAYEALQQAFGDHTDAVIELLRPDHDRLATKDDLALTGADLRTEMADLRTDLRTEMADLRTEMADLRTDLRTEMADLRTELRTEMADLRTELRTDMADLRVQFHDDITTAFAAQTRTLVIGLISAIVLIALSNALAVVAG
jgi:ribosomal protein L29